MSQFILAIRKFVKELTWQNGQQENIIGEWNQSIRSQFIEDAIFFQWQIEPLRYSLPISIVPQTTVMMKKTENDKIGGNKKSKHIK